MSGAGEAGQPSALKRPRLREILERLDAAIAAEPNRPLTEHLVADLRKEASTPDAARGS